MPHTMVKTAVVLLSGGMDSATALAMTIKEGHDVIGLTFDYGQRHRKEIDAAARIANHFRVVDHRIVTINLSPIGGSALTDPRIRVPEQRRIEEIGRGIPITYVPARNTILLAYALGLAEATAARSIVIAANQIDYSGYPDCRPEYYAAFREVARLGTKRGVEGDVVEIRTPLIRMSKADIIRKGGELPRRPPDDLRALVHLQPALSLVRLDARGRGGRLHAERRRRDGEEDPRPRGRPSVRRPGDSERVLDRRRTVAAGRVNRPRD